MNLQIHIANKLKQLCICEPMDIIPLGGGMINLTFEVTGRNHGRFIVQRMHPVFNEQTIIDQETICWELKRYGISAPDIITWWTDSDGKLWKVSRHIPHDREVKKTLESIKLAAHHLSLVHSVLKKSPYTPVPAIKGFHDTPSIISKLEAVYSEAKSKFGMEMEVEQALFFGKELSLPHASPTIIHGDPKWNNFLFESDPELRVAALIDWDTIMKGNPFVDIGDMVRSFCRTDDNEFDYDRLYAIVKGYGPDTCDFFINAQTAGKVITIELLARFLIDVVEDCYFDFDRSKFTTRRESNIASARKYLAYFLSM
jgi:thiamine kinase-like enzyme